MTSIDKPKRFYDLLINVSSKFPDKISFRKRSKDGKSFPGTSFSELKTIVDEIAAGLIHEGIEIGDRVTYLCDATPNWIQSDLAIVTVGGVSVPRGTDVVDEDIIYILSHSESRFAIVQSLKEKERLEMLKSNFPKLEKIYFMESDKSGTLAEGSNTILDLREKGRKMLEIDPSLVISRVNLTDPDELATLIYTSGTTGAPKGVMLSQTGWITAILSVIERLSFNSEDKGVSLLPPWHAFERAVEYAILALGIDFTVSNMTTLKDDLRDFKPTIFPSVPRIWESVHAGIMGRIAKVGGFKEKLFNFSLSVGEFWSYQKSIVMDYDVQIFPTNPIVSFFRKKIAIFKMILCLPFKFLAFLVFLPIHKALGGQLRVSISAGSALPSSVDTFLSSIGIKVLEGYGMTETSAVVSIRYMEKPTKLTVGVPIGGYEVKLKDDRNQDIKETGKKGTLWIKSKQILKGYYKRPDLNDKVFDEEGFFDTGDIMIITHRGELMFAGRAKDTIALAGGENVEPVPIEDRLHVSQYIDQVMVVGHDKKTLGVLIVPKFELLKDLYPNLPEDTSLWNTSIEVRALFKKKLQL
jgi:long-chain acyl-CoA synthetase